MRRPRTKKRDANQPQIVRALLAAGCTVEELDPVGESGLPDLLVGRLCVNYLLEVKVPGRARRKSATAERQALFRARWRGLTPVVVESITEALVAVGAVKVRAG